MIGSTMFIIYNNDQNPLYMQQPEKGNPSVSFHRHPRHLRARLNDATDRLRRDGHWPDDYGKYQNPMSRTTPLNPLFQRGKYGCHDNLA